METEIPYHHGNLQDWMKSAYRKIDDILKDEIAKNSLHFVDGRDQTHRLITDVRVMELYTRIINDLEALKHALKKNEGLQFVDFEVPNNNPVFYEETADGIVMGVDKPKEPQIPQVEIFKDSVAISTDGGKSWTNRKFAEE